MLLLTAGVGLWSLAHWVKRLAPALRDKLGNGGKGLIAVAILASVAMMVVGYGRAEGSFYWGRSPAMVGINNLLMLLALYLMVAASTRAWVTGVIRHPQLTAMKSWAVVSVILINKSEPNPARVVTTSAGREVSTGLVTIIAYGAVSFLHISLGYPVFG